MTVTELIEQLKQFPPEAEILISDFGSQSGELCTKIDSIYLNSQFPNTIIIEAS